MTTPADVPPPSGRRSQVSIRRPSVMLVRIERGEEQTELDLDSLGVQVYRVRHPLQACVRMHVVRPEVILLGASVTSPDMARVLYDAQQITAAVMPRSTLLMGDRLRDWVVETIDHVRKRRREALAAHVGCIFGPEARTA